MLITEQYPGFLPDEDSLIHNEEHTTQWASICLITCLVDIHADGPGHSAWCAVGSGVDGIDTAVYAECSVCSGCIANGEL